MKTFSYSFSAGETKVFPGGVHLELLSCPDTVQINYYQGGVELNERANGVSSGYFFTMPRVMVPIVNPATQLTELHDTLGRFEKVEIYSATAQTIVVGITQGDGGQRSTATQLIAGNAEIGYTRPRTLTTAYHALCTNSFTTIFTPAANTNGARIDTISFRGLTSGSFALLSKSSTPSSISDTSARVIAFGKQAATGSPGFQTPASNNIIVPAGEGLYHIADAASLGYLGLNYELL